MIMMHVRRSTEPVSVGRIRPASDSRPFLLFILLAWFRYSNCSSTSKSSNEMEKKNARVGGPFLPSQFLIFFFIVLVGRKKDFEFLNEKREVHRIFLLGVLRVSVVPMKGTAYVYAKLYSMPGEVTR